ncbi:MAG: hypothetical protein JO316_21815 [Abitibacteriaceae bacterium]|nr:hypothetical protein [Abditibacteriaceae bacterium]
MQQADVSKDPQERQQKWRAMKSIQLSRIRRVLSLGAALLLLTFGGISCSHTWPDANDLDVRDTGPAMDGFQLTIRAEKTQVPSGDPIWVQAALQNLSNKTAYVHIDKSTERDFFLVVQDEQHKLVSFTKYMDFMAPHPPDAAGDYPFELQKNRVLYFRVKANQLYEMTAPGQYLLTLKYKNYVRVNQEGPARLDYVVSNTVAVEVLPSKAVDLWTPTPIAPSPKPSKKPTRRHRTLR